MFARPNRPSTERQTADQPSQWTPKALAAISEQFEQKTAADILAWAVQHFDGEIALASSFGPQSIVLAHMLSQMDGTVTLFYIDTSLLFEETYALRDKLEARLGIRYKRVATDVTLGEQTQRFGPELWKNDSNACCYVRKVLPLRKELAMHKAWITGIRRDQSETRANAGLVEWDHTNQLVKFNPLANWSKKQVWDYILKHDLPYNELHDKGYPSIGCWPCTRSITAGQDERSGRWVGQVKTECGIHTRDNVSPLLPQSESEAVA